MEISKPQVPEWSKNLTMYEVNLRNFTIGGTFLEFEPHIERLKEMGVGILWFMPFYPIGIKKRKGSLGSYYSIKNFRAVNPQHGTLADFKRIVKKCHALGMYVIIDWVANHTSWDNDLTITNPEFYTKDANSNFKSPYVEWEDVIHLDYQNKDLWTYMIDSMKFWITEADIDGFRCDMAHLVTTDFWNAVRPELEKVKPMFMLAESENRDLAEQAFDCLYGWKIFHYANDIARNRRTVLQLDKLLETEIFGFPKNIYQLMFTSNHDENAWSGSAIERLGYALEVFNVLMFTLPGMPLIYSGQEAGNYRRLSLFDKDQIEWRPDKLYPFYKKLSNLKRNNPALWNGAYGGDMYRIKTTNDEAIFAFVRKKEDNEIFVILNLTDKEQQFVLNSPFTNEYRNIFTNAKETINFYHTMRMGGWEYQIFEK